MSRPSSPSTPEAASSPTSRRSLRRWVLLVVAAVFFAFVTYQVLNPFPDQPYVEISHGSHVHYVPKDRNQDVPVSNFPTRPPDANEHITPEGRIVAAP